MESTKSAADAGGPTQGLQPDVSAAPLLWQLLVAIRCLLRWAPLDAGEQALHLPQRRPPCRRPSLRGGRVQRHSEQGGRGLAHVLHAPQQILQARRTAGKSQRMPVAGQDAEQPQGRWVLHHRSICSAQHAWTSAKDATASNRAGTAGLTCCGKERAWVAGVRAAAEAGCCVGGAKRLEKGAGPTSGAPGLSPTAASVSTASRRLVAAACGCEPGWRAGCQAAPPPPTLACPLTAGELKSRRSGPLIDTIACPDSLGRLADCGTGGSKLSSFSCSPALRLRPVRAVGQRVTLARAPFRPLRKPTISSWTNDATAERMAHFDATGQKYRTSISAAIAVQGTQQSCSAWPISFSA